MYSDRLTFALNSDTKAIIAPYKAACDQQG